MNFYETPPGKAIGWAIHEQNSGIGHIRSCLALMRRLFDDGELTAAKFDKYTEHIDSAIKQQQRGIDSAYLKLKTIYDS